MGARISSIYHEIHYYPGLSVVPIFEFSWKMAKYTKILIAFDLFS